MTSLLVVLPSMTDPAVGRDKTEGCAGDCNTDARVAVDELIRGVNIALGTAQVGSCPSLDLNRDNAVAINELIAAVSNALTGCPLPSMPTPTSTPGESPTPPREPIVTIAVSDDAGEAGPDAGAFTVTRTGTTIDPLTVEYTIAGSAMNGVDYDAISTSVTIPPGSSTATVTITPIDDSLVEGTEGVILTLAAGAAYAVGAPGIAGLTIADDDLAAVTVTATDPDAAEAGSMIGTFTFTRSGDDLNTQLLLIVSQNGTASNGDYASLGGASFVVTIPAGETSAMVTITPLPDNLVEDPETVVLTIEPRLHYVVGSPGAATVTIADDPPVVTVTATDPDASESRAESGVFTVARSGGNLAAQLRAFLARGGTATNGTDYAAFGGATVSVPIAPNQSAATVTITPLDDTVVEGPETVILTVNATANVIPGTPGTATVTIADDD